MKMLRLVGLGVAIWALSLVWTEVNLILTPSTMIGLIVGLVAVAVVYRLSQRQRRCPEDNTTDHTTRHTHPTRPVPVMR
jgi:hypothetical protein